MSAEDDGTDELKIAARPTLQQCAICREDKPKLKLLACQHDFCANCLKRWYQQNSTDDKTVSCPHCRQVTRLLDGSVDSLPTKLAGQIRCLQCYIMKDLDDCWWCHFCSTAACR
ncbi:zinc finger, C3HC4 type [Trichuris suis]|nr:zinc finger, C3HC4 type [Trichuris suis]